MSSLTLTALEAGVLVGATTILSIGPNNLMMLRTGIQGGRILTVAGCVWISYTALLVCAYLAAGVPVPGPKFQSVVSWIGTAVLVLFAVQSFASAASFCAKSNEQMTDQVLIRRVLAVIWLNPLTYLEMFIMPVSLSAGIDKNTERMLFIIGLFLMSTICCLLYVSMGKMMYRLVNSSRIVQLFDLTSGTILTGVAISLAYSKIV